MDFVTYEQKKRADYSLFAGAVARILSVAIQAIPSIRRPQVQHRAKETDSLRKKLANRKKFESNNIEDDIKDLAGCRLIFYTNSDVKAFTNSGVLSDNFEIDWDRSKFHQPRGGTTQSGELFISDNYVVKLKADRSSLAEYRSYVSLSCEVQVQTILNHAWSELEHDTIYKRPDLPGGVGSRQMESVRNRMNKIMREHLLPAGYEFQKVLNDFERLSYGKDLFDRDIFTKMIQAEDNNVRHEILERFESHILPHYDDLEAVSPEIFEALISTIKEAQKTPPRPLETPYGDIPPKTVAEIAEVSARIINSLLYINTDDSFKTICELYMNADSDEEQECWLRSAEALSEYNVFIWKKVGPSIQARLVMLIDPLVAEENFLCGLLVAMLQKILSTEATGTSQPGHDRFAFHRGPVIASEQLRNIRARAIEQLRNLFIRAITDTEKRKIKSALSSACRMSGGSEGLALLVTQDCITIVDFWTEVVDTLSYELREELEEQLWWLRRHRVPKADARADGELGTAQQELEAAILRFRDHVNGDVEFVIYKTLVGFQSIFAPEWDNPDFDHEAKEAVRESLIEELVGQVTSENSEEWKNRIYRCAETKSNDMATFPSFRKFLTRLAETKPEIVMGYLEPLDERLTDFLPPIFIGLDETEKRGPALSIVRGWLNEGKYFAQIARYQMFTAQPDADILSKLVTGAISSDDEVSVLEVIRAIIKQSVLLDPDFTRSSFDEIITYLNLRKDTRWVEMIWYLREKENVLGNLTQEQVDRALDGLVERPEIDFHAEAILAEIGKRMPSTIIEFFDKRISRDQSDFTDRYAAVPFKFHKLGEKLSEFPIDLVVKARSWFEQDDNSLFTYRWGNFLRAVFPNWSDGFESALSAEILKGDQISLDFVVQVLRSYDGQTFIHGISKDLIAALEPEDPLLEEIEIALDATGRVSGSFGFVEAYDRKKALLETWKADPRPKVQSFANRHIHHLEQMIAVAQRRAEQEVELRKLDFEHNGTNTDEIGDEGDDRDSPLHYFGRIVSVRSAMSLSQ